MGERPAARANTQARPTFMIHLKDLLESTSGHLRGPAYTWHFSDFCFDSRRIEPGQLFLAVKTAKGDGHDRNELRLIVTVCMNVHIEYEAKGDISDP